MKRTALSLVLVGAIASGMVLFGSPSTAKADHRHTSVGVFVGSGGFSVGVGSAYYGGYRPVGFYGYGGYAVPSCCHLERVYVPSYCDECGWHPGFYRVYRVCDHHGRVFLY